MSKKYFLMGVLAIALAVAGGYGVKTSMNNDIQLNDLAMANIEALAGDEWEIKLPEVVVTCSACETGPCHTRIVVIREDGSLALPCITTGNMHDPGCW